MSFCNNTIQSVWNKATIVPGYDSTLWRKDQCGAWIGRNFYGNRTSVYGWEIDHVYHVCRGGSDALSNLRPLHWKNNASRNAGRLVCKVKSVEERNVLV